MKKIEKQIQFKNKLLTEKCSKNNYVWKEKNIMDRIKTFEDACLIRGVLPSEVYCEIIDDKNEIAYKKLKLIISVLNEGWKPNWINSKEYKKEYKYFPYFLCSSDFDFSDSYCDLTDANIGSRLCFKSRELSDYAAKQFLEIYKEYLM